MSDRGARPPRGDEQELTGVIGLPRDTVRVVPYHDAWPALFERKAAVLREHIGNLVVDIQHVGSTSVPGLDAKPIIDIGIALESLASIPPCRRPLLDLGYIDRGDGGSNGGYLFVREIAPAVRAFHLHLVTTDDPQWKNYLRFRDGLRADAALRERYGALKRELQATFAHDRRGYTRAKSDFIRGVLA